MSKWLPWMCAAMLAGCSGGSGSGAAGGSSSGGTSSGGTSSGGASSGGTSSGATPTPLEAAVQITSPKEGERIVGDRSIVVHGTATGTGVTSVTVSLNGGPGIPAPVVAGTFHVSLTLANHQNSIAATTQGARDLGPATAGPVHVYFPHLALSTFQAASAVLGQPDFTSIGQAGARADALFMPFGDAAWDGTSLYVADTTKSRVLVFAGVPTKPGDASPFFALGPYFEVGASSLLQPRSVHVADGRLLVADSGNNRVLIFDRAPGWGSSSIPSRQVTSPIVALGQPDLISSSVPCGPTSLNAPYGVTVVGKQVVVADTQNNRVLIWKDVPSTSGVQADYVLGQKTFDACAQNDETGTGTRGTVASARTLNTPTDVWTDGVRLYVADSGNNRVLIWNGVPTATQQDADLVLGQPDFRSVGSGTTEATLFHPYVGASNGTQLFVGDSGNHRVLLWNRLPTSSWASADVVLGQRDLLHADVGLASAQTLFQAGGIAVLDDALLVDDSDDNRVLVFRELPAAP